MLRSLYLLTGLRANIFDIHGIDVCLTAGHAPFCERINACPEGHARCEACDVRAVQECGAETGVRFYRCHAGVCEAILPIRFGGAPVAYLVIGQFLEDSSVAEQWEVTQKTLDWYPGDREALRKDYWELPRYSREEIAACPDILEMFSVFIQTRGMIRTAELTDLQKLELYLNEHYMEKLSLEKIAAELEIGRTKLCNLAKALSGGKTLSCLIAQRRVDAAKKLLLEGDLPISEIAERVGVSDYNYFTKVFRASVGETPSAFRKKLRPSKSR